MMITKDLKKLLQKLNDHTTRALEAAAGFCISRGHYEVSLEHRFQMVKIDEPSVEVATSMLRGIKAKYEGHHGIQISDEAIATAAKLAERFISGRQLPDKAVDLLDTSAARVRMGQTAKPASLDDVKRRLQNLDVKIAAIRRDLDTGVLKDGALIIALQEERQQMDKARAKLEERWKKESELVGKINGLSTQLLAANATDGQTAKKPGTGAEKIKKEIDQLKTELAEMQGEEPLVHIEVDGSIAAQVVAEVSKAMLAKMAEEQIPAKLTLGMDEAGNFTYGFA